MSVNKTNHTICWKLISSVIHLLSNLGQVTTLSIYIFGVSASMSHSICICSKYCVVILTVSIQQCYKQSSKQKPWGKNTNLEGPRSSSFSNQSEGISIKKYPGPRGFLLLFIGKFCDANRFLNFFLLVRSAESREKKASGRDRWEPHFHATSF